ncbi:hypothetical protein [Streptococcus ruminantium]|uniref:hypothetical protein n=1 Tax=Streptococcus ruminantium TaxID=1917441 RepID=UPI0018833385|nr:hypothetical protein [Streptococcus ruminantium]
MVNGMFAGQGIRSEIIVVLLNQLLSNFRKVHLDYTKSNPQASQLFPKVGFYPTGAIKEAAGNRLLF